MVLVAKIFETSLNLHEERGSRKKFITSLKHELKLLHINYFINYLEQRLFVLTSQDFNCIIVAYKSHY